MARYEIHGGTPLNGNVTISGAKNAAVAILPAALLVSGKCRIENVPDISDVWILLRILGGMGAKIEHIEGHTIEIDCSEITDITPNEDLVKKIRASYYLMGALLGRFQKAHVALPGGCNFAARPIDQHIKGFLALGADVDETDEYVDLTPGRNGLNGNRISLDMASVGATANLMIAAVLLPGQTVIENAAKEPHIVDLANFLNTMGARVSGAGTDTVKIKGVEKLQGGTYAIIPDQIEAGTYLAAVAATGGNVLVKNVIPKHMECITSKLAEMGAEIINYDDAIRIRSNGRLRHTTVKTLPYPGFPTDAQAVLMAALLRSRGATVFEETLFESRYRHVDELTRMGADIRVSGRVAVVTGAERLRGASVRCTDLRGGAALCVAALSAEGESLVAEIGHIDRGYADLAGDLMALGARITKR